MIGFSSYFPIEVKRLIVILVNVLFKVKGLDCAIFLLPIWC